MYRERDIREYDHDTEHTGADVVLQVPCKHILSSS